MPYACLQHRQLGRQACEVELVGPVRLKSARCETRFQDEMAIGSKIPRVAVGGPANKDVRVGQDMGITTPTWQPSVWPEVLFD